MARRRYQDGSLKLRKGKRRTVWVGRWREDEIRDGKIVRVLKEEVLGTLEDFPTKKLAKRELDSRLESINSLNYRPTYAVTFAEFAEKWTTTVVPNFKPSTQSSIRNQLKRHLIPLFGALKMRDFSPEIIQRFVSDFKGSPKTLRNLIAYLRSMWNTARAWKYVSADHEPFKGVRLPPRERTEQPFFTSEQIKQIIEKAEEPHKTFFKLAAETGMRVGELCALRWEDVDASTTTVQVRQSVWNGRIGTPKTNAGRRRFTLSPHLARRFEDMRKERTEGMSLVFHTRSGKPWDPANLIKDKLYPILDELKIPRCGFHAFRHGNATILDGFNTPVKTRQARLGHVDAEMTMGYTHAITADDRAVAEKLGDLFYTKSTSNCEETVWKIPEGPVASA